MLERMLFSVCMLVVELVDLCTVFIIFLVKLEYNEKDNKLCILVVSIVEMGLREVPVC